MKVINHSFKVIICCLVVLLSFVGCSKKSQTESGNSSEGIKMDYSQLLTIEDKEGYQFVTIKDPWKSNSILHQYALVDKNAETPNDIPENATIIKTPLERMCVSTSVHTNLMLQLGAIDNVTGVCESNYIFNTDIHDLINKGKITDVGSAMNPSVEKIAQLNSDALLMSPFEGISYGILEKTGVPIVECADYMETSVLGRAEWMKFYGLLVEKYTEAAKLFDEIVKNYNKTKQLVAKETTHPKLLADMLQGGAWYLPAGNSTYGSLYKETGATYNIADDNKSGSQALSLEKVMSESLDADIWLLKYSLDTDYTYETFGKENTAYTQFKAYKEKKIFGCNTSKVPFYDEAPFRPDYLIKDIVKILYPHLLQDYKLRFFTPLQ